MLENSPEKNVGKLKGEKCWKTHRKTPENLKEKNVGKLIGQFCQVSAPWLWQGDYKMILLGFKKRSRGIKNKY